MIWFGTRKRVRTFAESALRRSKRDARHGRPKFRPGLRLGCSVRRKNMVCSRSCSPARGQSSDTPVESYPAFLMMAESLCPDFIQANTRPRESLPPDCDTSVPPQSAFLPRGVQPHPLSAIRPDTCPSKEYGSCPKNVTSVRRVAAAGRSINLPIPPRSSVDPIARSN